MSGSTLTDYKLSKVIKMGELFNKMTSAEALMEAYRLSCIGSDWKESVQRYGVELWANTWKLQTSLRNGTYRQQPFVEFDINERGKHRHIKAISIADRVVQRSLCDNVLTPCTEPYLIYDNGASQKGKGVSFTRNRLKEHLSWHYRKYGNVGYIVLTDFHDFFGSLDHAYLLSQYERVIPDEEVMNLIRYLVSLNGNVGLGIGSQISQNAGVFYPTRLDQYFKTVCGIKPYAAYMDDRYAIFPTKDEAHRYLEAFRDQTTLIKLEVNERKTQIRPISRPFTFLKYQYFLTDTGKVIERPGKETFIRERRRLKKYKNKGLSQETISGVYKSWRGNLKNCHYRVSKMDELYKSLYGEKCW